MRIKRRSSVSRSTTEIEWVSLFLFSAIGGVMDGSERPLAHDGGNHQRPATP
jgi:hypothetical protein